MSLKSKFSSVASTYETAKLASRMTPQIKRAVQELGEDVVREALKCDIKMSELANSIYLKLSLDVRTKIDAETFTKLVVHNKQKVMKKNKNKKKVN